MSQTPNSNILIVGGGLALANYLARQGHEPTIIEQASEWRAEGYGIGLWQDGLSVLDASKRTFTNRTALIDLKDNSSFTA